MVTRILSYTAGGKNPACATVTLIYIYIHVLYINYTTTISGFLVSKTMQDLHHHQ